MDPRLRIRGDARTALLRLCSVALVLLLTFAAACGSDGNGSEPPGGSPAVEDDADVDAVVDGDVEGDGDDGDASAAEVEEFCAKFSVVNRDVPPEYIGSEEHVADIEAIMAVAPDDLVEALRTYRDYVASDAVSDENPEGRVIDNFPPDVATAVDDIIGYAATNC